VNSSFPFRQTTNGYRSSEAGTEHCWRLGLLLSATPRYNLAMPKTLSPIVEQERIVSPGETPQALAWHNNELWMGSRDLKRIFRLENKTLRVVAEFDAPGIPWAATSTGDAIWFTIGEGEEDDRYLRRYEPGRGFSESDRIACPDFTGSYLSYDGSNLYLSQWYNHRILKFANDWTISRQIAVGSEISGHTFVNGKIYVLCGTEQNGGDWKIARLDPAEQTPAVEELATVPFQCRSLAFDGQSFWTNHREADRVVRFVLPAHD
jgi:hypothetical protein